jgi:CHAT domain-containing protein/Flp pilus assembly protein TadD
MNKARGRCLQELSYLPIHWLAAFPLLLLLAPASLSQNAPTTSATVRQAGQLQIHRPFERELGPGQADVFTVDMAAGQFAHVVAEQQGVDVVVTVLSPDGKLIMRADSPNFELGPEPASWIARSPGTHRVAVSKSQRSAETGRYQIELADLREPSAADRARIDAENSLFAAVVEERTGGETQLPKAIHEYERAASLWHGVKDVYEEALSIHSIGLIYSHLGERQRAVECYGRSLALARALGDRLGEATILEEIGNTYTALGEKEMARQYLLQALALQRGMGNRLGEATILNDIGLAYSAFGEKQKALQYFMQLLPLSRAAGNRAAEARILNEIGVVYSAIGEKQRALDSFGQSLPLSRAIGDPSLEAAALSGMGQAYSDGGEKKRALEYLGKAMTISRAAGLRSQEALVLSSLGSVYAELGQEEKALEVFGQLLTLSRTAGSRIGEATTLNNMGRVYWGLGARQKAVEYESQALALARAVGDRSLEAVSLNNIGRLFSELGENQKALEYDSQALALGRAIGDRSLQTYILANIGRAYLEGGDKQKALEYDSQALPLARALSLRFVETRILENIGLTYSELGEKQKALEYDGQALALARAVADRLGEARILSNISLALKDLALPDAAICFGKQAVNVLQSIRGDNQQLPDELKRSYETSIGSIYRTLASLLVERQRFGEAEEVLSLLKDKETSDFIRRDAVADQLRPATLSDRERQALERYEQVLEQVVTLGQQQTALVDKQKDKGQLDPAEATQLDRFDKDLAAANRVLLRFLQEQEKAFAPGSALAKSTAKFSEEAAGVQKVLRQMGPDVAAIYTLVTPDKYIAILVTSGVRKAYTTAIKEAGLNEKIFQFRQLLQTPASNPLPLAQELYRIVFPEGLRQDLEAMKAKTIMWSIDSSLRYVPFSALHDGKDYLVKRFRNSLITPASLTSLADASPAVWQGAGFGVSEKVQENFNALPSVPAELRGIFRQNGTTGSAPIAGSVRLNADFTEISFKNDLRSKRNNVVHIATHFDSKPGVSANSHLLLGDGNLLSLDEIEDLQDLFNGVDLLTLSACSTAFTNQSEDGREVDSFGTIAQKLGAKGVIASLWSVNDDATARLMETMYRIRESKPELGKSEALRQAQEQMANGILKPQTAAAGDRGVITSQGQRTSNGWEHPYYWAPFILIGNWK